MGEAVSALWDQDDNGLRNLWSDDESDGELGPELDWTTITPTLALTDRLAALHYGSCLASASSSPYRM